MTKADIARKWRSKHPDWPNRKLARVMYEQEKLIFRDQEDARKVLRQIEGKTGKKEHVKTTHPAPPRPYNPYKLPESDESSFEPFDISHHRRILLLCDIHVPYHSVPALTAAIRYAKKEKPDAVLIGGDLFDFHGLSRYMKDPKKKSFAQELAVGVELLKTMQREFKCPIYFKMGNHDERYQHFLWMKAGELSGVEDFELETILKRRLPDLQVIDQKRIVKAGQLNIVHGHEFPSSIISPVNIARGLYLRAKVSTICGHHHRTSSHTEQNLNGKIVTTWSVGCLSELHPQYMPINSWNHGFALIDLQQDGQFMVRNKTIYKGNVY